MRRKIRLRFQKLFWEKTTFFSFSSWKLRSHLGKTLISNKRNMKKLFVKTIFPKSYSSKKLFLKAILKMLNPNTFISSKTIFHKSYSTQKLFSKSYFPRSYSQKLNPNISLIWPPTSWLSPYIRTTVLLSQVLLLVKLANRLPARCIIGKKNLW